MIDINLWYNPVAIMRLSLLCLDGLRLGTKLRVWRYKYAFTDALYIISMFTESSCCVVACNRRSV